MGRMACTEPQCLYKGALYLYLLMGYIEAVAAHATFAKATGLIVFKFKMAVIIKTVFHNFTLDALRILVLGSEPGHQQQGIIACSILFFILLLLLLARQSPVGQQILTHEVSISHTATHHIRWDSSGRVISSSQRPLPESTQHSLHTSMPPHTHPGEIRTHGLSKRAAADLRLRPRGFWDRNIYKGEMTLIRRFISALYQRRFWKIRLLVAPYLFVCLSVVRLHIITRWLALILGSLSKIPNSELCCS